MSYSFFSNSTGGAQGAQGPAGADGSTIDAGASTPPTAGGVESFDRYWLDTTTNEFYKLASGDDPATDWTSIADFSGNDGIDGVDGADSVVPEFLQDKMVRNGQIQHLMEQIHQIRIPLILTMNIG